MLNRKFRSKGHGIHSPFAFEVITNVLNSPYTYYAFTDIPEQYPHLTGQTKSVVRFNRISFMLVNYFKAKYVLEINPGNGINTEFITAPSSLIKYNSTDFKIGNPAHGLYDAIFINLHEEYLITDTNTETLIKSLIKLCHDKSFLVINPINSRLSKQFWQTIVKDKSISVTFDLKYTGIAFLRSSYSKQHYYV